MSYKYSKADLRHIAEYLIEDLRECEDGTVTTTRRLLDYAGYDVNEFEEWDLFGIHDSLFRAAKANHIKLDMSAHEGRLEGLPFNLDYVVHNSKAQIKCPRCGSKNTARIIYGYPLFSEKMQKVLDEGKWVLGGCIIRSVKIDGKPVTAMAGRRCNDCGKDFSSLPVVDNPKRDTYEYYSDIVTSIRFFVGGYFGGFTEVKIKKNDKGALVEVSSTPIIYEPTEPSQITTGKWYRIVNTLYNNLYLHEWKKSYVDLDVLDGTQWELDIKLTDKRVRHYSGSNEYPPYWKELVKIFREYAKF